MRYFRYFNLNEHNTSAIEVMVVVAIVLVLGGLLFAGLKGVKGDNAGPEVVKVQQKVTPESTPDAGKRTLTKVQEGQIESFLSNLPYETEIIAVVPVMSTSLADSWLEHYLVITEKRE